MDDKVQGLMLAVERALWEPELMTGVMTAGKFEEGVRAVQ